MTMCCINLHHMDWAGVCVCVGGGDDGGSGGIRIGTQKESKYIIGPTPIYMVP